MLYLLLTILFGALAAYFSKEFYKPGPVFALIIIFLGFMLFIGGISKFKEAWYINHHYQPTVCTVVQHLKSSRNVNCAKLLMQYSAANRAHTGTISLPCRINKGDTDKLLAQFGIGEQHPCWYDEVDYTKLTLSGYQNPILSYFLMGFGLYLIFWMCYHAVFGQRPAPQQPVPDADVNLPRGPLADVVTVGENVMNAWVARWLLICLFGVLMGFYLLDRDWYAAKAYITTQCEVLDKKINVVPDKTVTWYSAMLNVSYQAGSHPYKQWIKLSDISTGDREAEQKALDPYTVNQKYSCWYDPENPAAVTLARGVSTFRCGMDDHFFYIVDCVHIGMEVL